MADENVEIIRGHCGFLLFLNRRPSTIAKRAHTLDHLSRFAEGRSLLELDFETLRGFVDRPTTGPDARANAVSHLRGFYRWAWEEGLVSADPTVKLKRPRRPRRLPRPMGDHVAAYALHRAPDPLRQWFWLAAYAGLRCCEIAPLRGTDFLLHQSPPILVIRESKGGDPSVVPIAAPLIGVASELAAVGNRWCFPKGEGDPAGIERDGHVSANQVQRRANRWLHDAGFPDTIHRARHWFGTTTYRATGGDIRKTQELLRHKSPNSTAIYTLVTMHEGAEALDRLPVLEDPGEDEAA